jgi:hypothetical protein
MKVGIGVADITPAIGMRTEIFQNLKVDKIVSPLLLKVCIMDSAAAVVTADVMDFFADSIEDIRSIVHDVSGIAPSNIFLNSSHSHSSPYIYPSAQRILENQGTGFLNLDYYDSMLEAVRQAAYSALQNQQEAVLSHSRGLVAEVACNRRSELEDGTIGIRYGRDVPEELRSRPDGLIDPAAECLWFHKPNGELIGAFVNYACHGTSYNQYSEICWDYMGYARADIEKALGGQVLFLQGCAGNMSPGKYTTHEPLEDAMLLGKRLADAVLQSYQNRSVVDAASIKASRSVITLKGRTTLSAEELDDRLKLELEKVRKNQAIGTKEPYGAMVISYLERLLMVRKHPDLIIPSEIGIINIGSAVLVFLPGECFIQYALEIKRLMAGKPVLVMAYTDCTLQYIPNAQAYEDTGGYETDPDWCYSEKGNGEKLVQEVLRLLPKES